MYFPKKKNKRHSYIIYHDGPDQGIEVIPAGQMSSRQRRELPGVNSFFSHYNHVPFVVTERDNGYGVSWEGANYRSTLNMNAEGLAINVSTEIFD